MKFLVDFYNDEPGEIKLPAVILFVIGILILIYSENNYCVCKQNV